MGWTFYKADGSIITSAVTASTATVATTVTVSDNESTNENNVLTFVAGADADGGNVGLESDGNLHYNPSTGLLTSTGFSGTLTGLLQTAAQTNVTSLSTLTALQVDYINANASTITITDSSDTGDLASLAVATHGATTLTTTDDDASAADLTLDADGEIVIDAADAAGIFLGINGTNQINLVDGVLKPVTTNDIDLGVSGGPEFKNGYFDGTLEADAITIGGTNVVTGSLVTTLGTISAGVWQGTVVAAAYLPDASTSAQGVIESAIASEVDTGTSDTLAVTPDSLAGSNYGEKVIQMVVVDFATALTVQASGAYWLHVPSTLHGFDIIHAHAETLGDPSGTTITIGLYNVTDSVEILSGLLTIGIGEHGSDESGGSYTINSGAGYDSLAENDLIYVSIDQIGSGDPGTGLIVTLICRLP